MVYHHLDQQSIDEVYNALIQLGPPSLTLLLGQLPRPIAASLNTVGSEADRLRHALQALNQRHSFVEPPSSTWLATVLHTALSLASGRLEEETLARVLVSLERASPDLDDCPYPGLEAFEERQHRFFFGREQDVEDIRRLLGPPALGRKRWVQIDGASGAGKSSLVRAGLVPAIKERGVEGGPGPRQWLVAILRPGADPVRNLAIELAKTLSRTDLAELQRQLSSSERGLADALALMSWNGRGLLVVIDQFEEVFTLAGERARQDVDGLLAAAMADAGAPLYVVTTIRSDFQVRFDQLPRLARCLNLDAQRRFLPRIEAIGLRRAVVGPAENVDLEIPTDLVDRLVSDTAARTHAGLPLLAHALRTLWERREGGALSATTYAEIGGIGGALAQSADFVINGLESDELRERARKMLLGLVTTGDGTEDTRRPMARADALEAAGGGPAAEQLLALLSGGRSVGARPGDAALPRLIVVSSNDGAITQRVDLAHETLIQSWGTLRRWINEHRADLERRDQIEQLAQVWESSGSSPDGLLWGAQRSHYQAVHGEALSTRARHFLRLSGEVEAQEMQSAEQSLLRRIEERAQIWLESGQTDQTLIRNSLELMEAEGVVAGQRGQGFAATMADFVTASRHFLDGRDFRHFRVAEIETIYQTALGLGLAEHNGVLLTGSGPDFVASLPLLGIAHATQRMRRTLQCLNEIKCLRDGTVPLKVWLQNAFSISRLIN